MFHRAASRSIKFRMLDFFSIWWTTSRWWYCRLECNWIPIGWCVVILHSTFFIRLNVSWYSSFRTYNITGGSLDSGIVILVKLHILLIWFGGVAQILFLGTNAPITVRCLPSVVNILFTLFNFLAGFFVVLSILLMPNFELRIIFGFCYLYCLLIILQRLRFLIWLRLRK